MIAEADRAYSIAEAAQRLGFKSRTTVYQLVAAGLISTVVLPGTTVQRITSTELARYINTATQAA